MSFIVIEGLDGSGKSTQLRMLRQHLSERSADYFFLHFPRTDAPVFGEMIARFLRGDLGRIEDVDPYLVALLYAGDRRDAAEMIRSEQQKRGLVLVDRYVYSNIAFQCAKLKDPAEQEKLRDWILFMEYEHFRIPRPDLNLFLDVPFAFTAQQLTRGRKGTERDYLHGRQDIHEENLRFQEKVREIYLSYAAVMDDCVTITCYDDKGAMLPEDEIFKNILDILEQRKMI